MQNYLIHTLRCLKYYEIPQNNIILGLVLKPTKFRNISNQGFPVKFWGTKNTIMTLWDKQTKFYELKMNRKSSVFSIVYI